MRNKLYHKYLDLKSNPYFLDYLQVYFRFPLEEIQEIEGFSKQDCKTWLTNTAFLIHDQISRSGICGVRVGNTALKQYADVKNYGIKIYFGGEFFDSDGKNSNSFAHDVSKAEKLLTSIQTQIIECQYNPNPWLIKDIKFINNLVRVEFPQMYVSRLDISQNLYHTHYPKGLESRYHNFGNGLSKQSNSWENYCHYDDNSNQKTSQVLGNRKHVHCEVYNKVFEEKGHANALRRFKTVNFWRREWKVGKRMLRQNKFNLVSQFYLLKKIKAQKILIASIRKAVDIVLYDDRSNYTIFHHTHVDKHAFKDLAKDSLNGAKRLAYMMKISKSFDKAIPQYETRIKKWDGSANVLGIIKKYRDRWSHDQWIDILNELIKQPERLPKLNKTENNFVDIGKVKEFLAHIKYR